MIVIQSRAGQHLLDSDPVAAHEAMDVIVAVAAEAAADIGALVELMDPELARPLTRELLDELVTRASATGTAITAEIAGSPDDLNPSTAVAAHLLVQEALTNAFRHAPGAPIRLTLRCLPPVTLDVTNDSPPSPDPLADLDRGQLAVSGAGRGFIGLRERVTALDGRLAWGPTAPGGWRVTAQFPA